MMTAEQLPAGGISSAEVLGLPRENRNRPEGMDRVLLHVIVVLPSFLTLAMLCCGGVESYNRRLVDLLAPPVQDLACVPSAGPDPSTPALAARRRHAVCLALRVRRISAMVCALLCSSMKIDTIGRPA